jgi:hypothetical protein
MASTLNVSGAITATDLLIDTDVIVTDSTNDRVGINKTSPATTLDVGGNIYFSGIVRGTSDGSESAPSIQPGNDGDTGLFRPTANTIGFSTGGTERMRIISTGIDVTGAINLGDTYGLQWGTGNERITGVNTGNSLRFITNNQERMRVNTTGIDVTGTAVTDGLTVAGNVSVDGGTIKLDGNLSNWYRQRSFRT